MTLRSRLVSLFPGLALLVDLAAVAHAVIWPKPISAAIVAVAVYLFPLSVFRLVTLVSPIRDERARRLDLPEYSPWWGGHQLQLIYETFPFLEAALRLVPGLFSLWLRAWGSKIGRRVYWPPTIRVIDRSLVEIGDGVVFGHHVELVSHFVASRRGSPLLFVKRIVIGSSSLVGTHVALGPGVEIGEGAVIGAFSRLGPGTKIEKAARVAASTEVVSNQHIGASDETD